MQTRAFTYREGLFLVLVCSFWWRIHMRRYWNEKRNKAQPFAAYALNTKIIIHQLRKKLNTQNKVKV